MIHNMNLHKAPFEMIEKGLKTFELRLYDEKRQQIHQGDEIIFTNTSDNSKTLRVKVLALHLFPNFAALYTALPLDKCGYLPREIPSASPDDMNAYYPPEKQALYGVVAIEIKVI
ncbi:MAG: ASCH domain-containing protein [Clostridia bacterium]|nr:ASCH domain-containing protein [Clostridia bacterium]MBR3865572.1 ASCH domain-containing protein [Clostridia bacterium]